MSRLLSLTILPSSCRVPGCLNLAGSYGVCRSHQDGLVKDAFDAAVREGVCSATSPSCFPSSTEWREYVVAAVLCRNTSERRAAPVEFCRDCTPEYKREQMEAGKCAHPETVFIRSERYHGDVIGVCIQKTTGNWERAMMGLDGDVVAFPPDEIADATMTKIQQDAAPKKRGPRFKKDRV